MDCYFSNFLCLLNNRQKSDSFNAYIENHFNTTMSCTYLCKYMTFKVVKQIKHIGAMKHLQNPTATYACRNVY